MSSSLLPTYVEDVLTERAGVLPAVLFGAGTSGAIALFFPSSRPYALWSAVFGGMMGAAFALAAGRQKKETALKALHASEVPHAHAPVHPLHSVYAPYQR